MTAITRLDSQSKLPEGVASCKVDYTKPETLVSALQGQDALVITLSGGAPKDTEMQLINAAGKAGVPWILPSEFAPDTANEALVNDVFIFQPKRECFQNVSPTTKTPTDRGLSPFQPPSARPSKILARALSSLSPPAFGMSILSLWLRALASTSPTGLLLSLMMARLRSPFPRFRR